MMAANLLSHDEIVRLLAGGPDRVYATTKRHADDELAQRPAPDEWSPNEILAHLRCCQDVWGDDRVVRMLTEDHPTIRAVNPRTWLAQTDYPQLPFHESLEAFTSQRGRFVTILSDLSPEQWTRSGTFTGGGRPREYSVHTEADALARHERSHIKQIEVLCATMRQIG
jgi:hypothetical protein